MRNIDQSYFSQEISFLIPTLINVKHFFVFPYRTKRSPCVYMYMFTEQPKTTQAKTRVENKVFKMLILWKVK